MTSTTTADFARWPLNLLAVAISAALGLFTYATLRAHPAGRPPKLMPSLHRPGSLPPALAGALVAGRIATAQHVATILDLAGRGAIAFEPTCGQKKRAVQLLPVDESLVRTAYERSVWRALAGLADEAGVIGPKASPKLGTRFGPANEALRSELEALGWWDRRLLEQARPLLAAGIGAIALALAAFAVSIVGNEGIGLVGTFLLAGVGALALAVAVTFPQTTALGQAGPPRGAACGPD